MDLVKSYCRVETFPSLLATESALLIFSVALTGVFRPCPLLSRVKYPYTEGLTALLPLELITPNEFCLFNFPLVLVGATLGVRESGEYLA